MLKRRAGRNEIRDHDAAIRLAKAVIRLAKAIGESVDAGDLSKARRKIIRLSNRMAATWTGWDRGRRLAGLNSAHRPAKRLRR